VTTQSSHPVPGRREPAGGQQGGSNGGRTADVGGFAPWFWAHDVRESQLSGLLTGPDAALAFLRGYDVGNGPRYAAVVCRGIESRSWTTGLTAAGATAGGGTPVGIDSCLVDGERRFVLLATRTPTAGCFVGTDLTVQEVNCLLREGNRVVDHAAYRHSSSCRYAVVLAPGGPDQELVECSSVPQLRRTAALHQARPTQLRFCDGAPEPRCSAVLCRTRMPGVRHRSLTGLDADDVSHTIRKEPTTLTDFHAYRAGARIRFTLATRVRRRRWNPFGT